MTSKKTAIALAALGAAVLGAGAAIAAPGHMRQPPADMTRAQATAKANEMFDRMDVNKDGKLDAADRAARKAQMFDRIDTDKNGSISRAEFDAHHAQMGERRGGHGGHAMGQRMGGMKHHGGMGGAMGGMAMRADANGDKALTREEIVNAALSHFDRADTNRDGTVTVAERQAARQAMRAQWQAMKNRAPAAN